MLRSSQIQGELQMCMVGVTERPKLSHYNQLDQKYVTSVFQIVSTFFKQNTNQMINFKV